MTDREDRFTWQEGDLVVSQCLNCKWKFLGQPGCSAFPRGIPMEIMSNRVDHTLPYLGDHGIQFEPAEN